MVAVSLKNYLSVLLRPRCPLEEVSTLTAWTAVAVCNAVERVCGVRPGIKWPNDVILDGRKLCGILTELELEAETAALRHVVVGVGINLTQTAADFGPEVAPVAVSLAQALGRAPRRAEMAAAVLAALDELYAAFPAERAAWLERWVGETLTVLFEEEKEGLWRGHAPNYTEVFAPGEGLHNVIKEVKITGIHRDGLKGSVLE